MERIFNKVMASNTRKQLENWLKTIDVNADSVLDVGGWAIPVKGRTKTWEAKDYKILDYAKEVDYCRDLNKEIKDIPQFNIVFCLEVMEYVWNPVLALQNINRFLKDNGILYISFHFLFPHHHPFIKDRLRYTYCGIEKLLKETGFEISEVVKRMAKNPQKLIEWCYEESKIVDFPGEIGYLIKAKKVEIGDKTP